MRSSEQTQPFHPDGDQAEEQQEVQVKQLARREAIGAQRSSVLF